MPNFHRGRFYDLQVPHYHFVRAATALFSNRLQFDKLVVQTELDIFPAYDEFSIELKFLLPKEKAHQNIFFSSWKDYKY